MTATSIVIFSVLRGFSQATGAVMQAIFSEEFNDEQVRVQHRATSSLGVPSAFSSAYVELLELLEHLILCT
eukprot:COSAG02_NODE_675_length_18611_cov_7.033492_6_plen_71_part_00